MFKWRKHRSGADFSLKTSERGEFWNALFSNKQDIRLASARENALHFFGLVLAERPFAPRRKGRMARDRYGVARQENYFAVSPILADPGNPAESVFTPPPQIFLAVAFIVRHPACRAHKIVGFNLARQKKVF